MARLLRRTKRKVFRIRFADGKTKTVADMDIDENDDNKMKIWVRNPSSMGIVLIFLLAGVMGWIGYMAGGLIGAFVGAVPSAFIMTILSSFFMSQSIGEPLRIPKAEISGLESTYMFKSGNYTACCHTYDSNGNEVTSINDPMALLQKKLGEANWMVEFLADQIVTLRYHIYEMLKSRKEISGEIAAELKQMVESTVTQIKTRREDQTGKEQQFLVMGGKNE